MIGGLAVQRWGPPRQTRDADLTLLKDDIEAERTLQRLFSKQRPD